MPSSGEFSTENRQPRLRGKKVCAGTSTAMVYKLANFSVHRQVPQLVRCGEVPATPLPELAVRGSKRKAARQKVALGYREVMRVCH